MALTRAKKTQKVEVLAKELANSTSAIVGTFAKLTVSQDFVLRQKVREAGGRYSVLKNKLAARASQGTQIEAALQGLKGVSSVAYTSGDPVALAKALSAWVKDNAEFTFKLGIVDGKVITVEEVQALATMPGKEELFAKLLFLINAPATRLATVLNATGRNIAVVIDQAVQQEKFAAPEAKVAPAPEAAAAVPAEVEAAPEAAAPVVEAPVAEEAAPVSEALPTAKEVQAGVVEKAPEEIAEVSAAPLSEATVKESAPVVEAPESTSESAADSVPTIEEVQAEVVAKAPEDIAAVTEHPASETVVEKPTDEEAGS